jgi:hypothetical protein
LVKKPTRGTIMEQKQPDDKCPRPKQSFAQVLFLGFAVGAGVAIALGVAMHSAGVGIGIGVGVGLALTFARCGKSCKQDTL